MKEHSERKEILGGKCIEHEVEWHARHSITYLTRGLVGIDGEQDWLCETNIQAKRNDELQGGAVRDGLAFDCHFGCRFFPGTPVFEVIG